MSYDALFQPGRIGKLEIRNRIVMPSLNNNYTHSAYMTDESVEFYAARARGGAGLIILEATSVDYPRSRSVLNPAIDDDKYLDGIRRIAQECHRYGAKVMVQLSHVGRQTRVNMTGMAPVAPSPIASKSPLYPDTPHVLSVEDIHELVEKFGSAAARAQRTGMDGVEVIMGHGYLANNFLTPLSNQRTDEYGGIAGGVRFCREIIASIRAHCGPDFPIICRINGDDYVKEGGNTPVEAQMIAQQLEAAGADCINVSAGMRDSELSFNDHCAGMPHASWLHLAERIRRGVKIPVISVKRFTPEIADWAVAQGKADFIAFGKQMIADPDFANKLREGREADVIPCTSCCQGCYDRLWMRKPITCMLNPKIGRPLAERAAHEAFHSDARALVVGAGPAGCEAALELRRAGMEVTLIERENRIGGLYGCLEHTQMKAEVADAFAYFRRALEQSGVTLRLSAPLTPELLDECRPDVVVDASGADFKRPKIEGADLPIVVDARQALDGSREVGEMVVIVACGYGCSWTCQTVQEPIPDDVVGAKTSESHACSAGHAAADVAEELARRGKRVSIITERDSFAPGMGFTNRGNLFKRFFPMNITVSNRVKVKRIVENGLICEKEGMEFFLCADTVVMSVGMTGRSEVKRMVEERGIRLLRAGDCVRTGNAFSAFQQGYEVVERLQEH